MHAEKVMGKDNLNKKTKHHTSSNQNIYFYGTPEYILKKQGRPQQNLMRHVLAVLLY